MDAKQKEKENYDRNEIETTHSLNMFVEAGAGAGKTELITRKIVNMLQKGYKPGEIVVITFTNAAAEELRGRIIGKVEDAAKNDEEMKEQLKSIDQMNISTIHSFCSLLLEEQSVLAGLPQNIRVMDETENIELREKYLEQYLGSFCNSKSEDESEGKDNNWEYLLNKRIEWKDDKELKNIQDKRKRIRKEVAEIYEQICDLPEDIDICIPFNKEGILPNFAKDIRDFFHGRQEGGFEYELLKLINDSRVDNSETDEVVSLAAFLTERQDMIGGKLEKAAKLYTQNGSEVTEDDYFDTWDSLFGTGSIIVKGKNKSYDKDKIKKIDAVMKLIRDGKKNEIKEKYGLEEGRKKAEIEEVVNKEEYFKSVVETAKKAVAYYKENRPKNLISNDGLLQLTRTVICDDENTEICDYFREKYRTFFVDEFQDTDHVQTEIIYRLASDRADKKHEKLRDGALFLVGDPKQSIYRFRGAEPKNFFTVQEKMKRLSNARIYRLQFNHRSNQEVISWIDKKFEELHKTEPIVDAGGYLPMECIKPAIQADNVLKGIYYYKSPDTYEGKTDSKKDVEAVVNLIRKLVHNDACRITVHDKDGKPYLKEIEYRDFLLICKNAKKHDEYMMDPYIKALHHYNIPVWTYGKISLKEEAVLRTYVRLYKYLVLPLREHRLGALEALRVTLPCKTEEEFQKTAEKILDHLFTQTKKMTDYGKAQFLEKQVALLFKKQQVIANVDTQMTQTRIRQMLESVFSMEPDTGIGLVKRIDDYLNNEIERELSLEKDPDAVRFMNLHKTKGLEGNIVVFVDRRGRDEKIEGAYRQQVKNGDEEKTILYPGMGAFGRQTKAVWTAINSSKELIDNYIKDNRAEEHRLEYVMATRAKQAVIFMDVLENKKGLFGPDPEECAFSFDIKDDPSTKSLQQLIDSVNMGNCAKMTDSGEADSIDTEVLNNDCEKIDSDENPDSIEPYNVQEEWDRFNTELQDAEEENHNYKRISPSKLEKKNSPIKDAARQQAKDEGRTMDEEESKELPRPLGNIAGNVLHRAMELLVNRLALKKNSPEQQEADEIISYCVRQAVAENIADIDKKKNKDPMEDREDVIDEADDMYYEDADNEMEGETITKTVEDTVSAETADDTGASYDLEDTVDSSKFGVDQYEAFVMACVKAYCQWFYGEFGSSFAQEYTTYTELPFQYAYEEEGEKKWMNGTADLVLQNKKDEFVIIDYKSDNDRLIPENIMHEVLKEKYKPQLDAYERILYKIFEQKPKKIRKVIVSFSQKDENGKLYTEKKVRVRTTELG